MFLLTPPEGELSADAGGVGGFDRFPKGVRAREVCEQNRARAGVAVGGPRPKESITDVGDSNFEDLLCAALLMERKLRKMLRATNALCLH